MNQANIMEVFASLQGEGKYVGVWQVFVRFFECHMHCVWCDTPHSIGDTTRRFETIDADALFARIQELSSGVHSISITGGEPLLQADFLADFLPRLRQAGMRIYLETSGALPEALARVKGYVDIISMDLKLPSSTGCRPYWDEHRAFLEIAKGTEWFVKAVVSSQTSAEDIDIATNLMASVDPEALFILQPNYFDLRDGVISLCLEYQERCARVLKDVRVIPQTHKMMKLR